jgi:CHAT domain-containing protein/tetratricopeptide (TPR) repeat protein
MTGLSEWLASARVWLAMRRDPTGFCRALASQGEDDYLAGDHLSAAHRFLFVTRKVEEGHALPADLAAYCYGRAGLALASLKPNPDPDLAQRLLVEAIRRYGTIEAAAAHIADLQIILGHVLIDMERPEAALEAFRNAEAERPESIDRLSGAADAMQRMGDLRGAETAWQLVLAAVDRLPKEEHQSMRAYVLERLGLLLLDADRNEEAAATLQQAVEQGPVLEPLHASNRLNILASLTWVNGTLGRLEPAKAAAAAWQELLTEVGPQFTSPTQEVRLLSGLGWAHVLSGAAREALPIFARAVALMHSAGFADAFLLYRYGVALSTAGDLAEAGIVCRQALDALGEANSSMAFLVYGQLARVLVAEKRFDAGIFFHKMNLALRNSIGGAARTEIAEAIESGNERHFAELGEALIDRGRLAEAEQVGRLLQEIELDAIIGRGFVPDPRGVVLTLTSVEDEWRKELEMRLANARPRPPLGSWVDTLDDDGSHAGANRIDLLEWAGEDPPPGVWVVKTLTTGDKILVVVSANALRSVVVAETTAQEIAKRVYLLRRAMTVPGADIASYTAPFYRLLGLRLLDPLWQDQASTTVPPPRLIAFDLDGPLRYLPVAALWDGTGWLIERVAVTQFARDVPAIRAVAPAGGRGQEPPGASPRAASIAAFGTTRSHHGLPGLPGVRDEIDAIVAAEGKGALQSVVFLDEGFDRERLNREVRRHPLVHVASHFEFHPSAPHRSGLLLGDGSVLSLHDLSEQFDFRGVRLATLSACETGLETWDSKLGANFAIIVRSLGAEAVAATLWRVGDQATAELMGHFYRALAVGAAPAEALRAAQLALLGRPARPWNEPARPAAAANDRLSDPQNWSGFVIVSDVNAALTPVVGERS